MEDDTARQIMQEMEATAERHRLIVAHLVLLQHKSKHPMLYLVHFLLPETML